MVLILKFWNYYNIDVVSSFLDPNFGLDVFPHSQKEQVKRRIKRENWSQKNLMFKDTSIRQDEEEGRNWSYVG